MKLFGFEITKATPAGLSPPYSRSLWQTIIQEPYSGAWQRNDELVVGNVLDNWAVFACITLIASDIAKLRPMLLQQTSDGIWQETESPAFSPVLRSPNRYQNHIQFKEHWVLSKLTSGNTYALKGRDNRGVVTALYVLDPTRVQVLIADDGSVYYELNTDSLAGLPEQITVPASEIIHDRFNCLYHPLIGVSPLYASALAASAGSRMLGDQSTFFGNGAVPSGILTAPGALSPEKAVLLKEQWNSGYTGTNKGKTAVLGDGMKFEAIKMTAVDSQLVEQMKFSAEMICSTFHVPAFKIGAGTIPAGQKVEDLNQIYYSDCLQGLIEAFELGMDEGLRVRELGYGVSLDLDGLLRMDTATQYKTLGEGIKNSILAPNEARLKLGLPPVQGGDSPMAQQQEFSLEALSKRDAGDPFAKPEPAPQPEPELDENSAEQMRACLAVVSKGFEHV